MQASNLPTGLRKQRLRLVDESKQKSSTPWQKKVGIDSVVSYRDRDWIPSSALPHWVSCGTYLWKILLLELSGCSRCGYNQRKLEIGQWRIYVIGISIASSTRG